MLYFSIQNAMAGGKVSSTNGFSLAMSWSDMVGSCSAHGRIVRHCTNDA